MFCAFLCTYWIGQCTEYRENWKEWTRTGKEPRDRKWFAEDLFVLYTVY